MSRQITQACPGQPKPALTKLKALPVTERYILMDFMRGKTYVEASPLVEINRVCNKLGCAQHELQPRFPIYDRRDFLHCRGERKQS